MILEKIRPEVTITSRLAPLAGFVWTVLAALAVVVPVRKVYPQTLEPRSYVNTPVGINFLLAGYGYTKGNIAFDASSPITDAKVRVNSGVLGYARSLDVWGLSGKFAVALPIAKVSGSAKHAGEERERVVSGLGDPVVRFSVNFYGAPAISMDEFATYEQDIIVGASLQVSPPLGQYDSTKLLNGESLSSQHHCAEGPSAACHIVRDVPSWNAMSKLVKSSLERRGAYGFDRAVYRSVPALRSCVMARPAAD